MDNLPFMHPDILWFIAFGFTILVVCGLVGFIFAIPILLWPKVATWLKRAPKKTEASRDAPPLA
jgi:hypothetical protein